MAALGGFAAINLGGGVGGAGGGAERAWAREAAESGLRRRVQAALALARAPGGGGEAVRAALEKLLQDPDLRQGVPERGPGPGGGRGRVRSRGRGRRTSLRRGATTASLRRASEPGSCAGDRG